MNKVIQKSWPRDIRKQLTYRLGEIPLHEYVKKNAKYQPDRTALQFYGKAITWHALDDAIDRLSQFFIEKGIQKGDRIGLYMQNCPQYIIGHFAVQRIGGVVVPLNPMYKETELIYLVNEAAMKIIIAGQELYSRIQNIAQEIKSLEFTITTNYADFLPEELAIPFPEELMLPKQSFDYAFDLLSIIDETDPLQDYPVLDIWEDVALLVFTSGTTGRPKGAMLTHGNALFKTAAAVSSNQIRSNDVLLAVAPLCHIAGMLMGVNILVYSGCETVLLTKFEPQTAITAIEKYQVTTWYSIAVMNTAILNMPGIEERNLTSLRLNMATSFGIPVTEPLALRWRDVTDGCLMFEAAYGLSETHTGDTFMPQENVKYGTCGIPTYETEIKIIESSTGEEVPIGTQGEIIVKNPGVFKGYLNRPEATAETLRDGWVYTGDIGKLDEDGYLYYLGRVKELIKCSGYSVFPEDVEALLGKHPAVLQSVAVGIPDKKRGESVKAFVVLKPAYKGAIQESEIITWAKENMAAYKYPREIEFIESLPTTSSGKVLRRLLKKEREADD